MVSRGFDLMARLRLDAADFQSGLKSAGHGLQGFSDKLTAIRGPLLVAGGALAGAGVLSVKAAIDFESAFAGVRKTVDATEEQFAELSDGIRGMAKELPAGTTEIAAVAEAAGQLGIRTEAILEFTRTMIDLGETTNLTSDQAATALARLANITQLPQSEFDRLGSTIVALGNNLATTEAEIVDFGLRIAGAGKIAGLTEAQILAIGGAMSSVGVEAEAGGTAVQKVLLSMVQAVATGGEQLAVFQSVAQSVGVDFSKTFQEDAAGAFAAFVEGLGRAGNDAFVILEELGLQDQRLIRSFLSLANAGDLLTDSLDLGTAAWGENSALLEEAEKRYDTSAARLKILNNQLTDARIEVGEMLLPALEKMVEIGTKLLDWFQDLPRPVKEFTVILGAVTAGMIALGLAIPPVIALVAAFGVTSNIALAGIPAAIGLIVTGIAFMAYKWEEVVEFMKGAGGWILAAFGPIGIAAKLVIDNWDLVKKVVRNTVNSVIDQINRMVDMVNELIRTVNKVGSVFGTTIDEIDFHLGRWEASLSDTEREHKRLAETVELDLDTMAGGYEDMAASVVGANNVIVESVAQTADGMVRLGDGVFEFYKAVYEQERALTDAVIDETGKRIVARGIEAGAVAAFIKSSLPNIIGGGTVLQGGLPFSDFDWARSGENAQKALADIYLGAGGPPSTTGGPAVEVNVTVNGDIHRDDAERVAAAMEEAVRRGLANVNEG